MSSQSASDEQLLGLATELRVAMGRLGRQTRGARGGLTPSQLSALTTIDECGALRLNELAAREGVAAPTMSRGVDILEHGGLGERTRDPSDARSSFIELTKRGRELVGQAADERTTLLAARLRELDAASVTAIRKALPALRQLTERSGALSGRPRGTAR